MFASPQVLYHNKNLDGNLRVDFSIDVYSFGALVYYLLTQKPLPVDVARICFQEGIELLINQKNIERFSCRSLTSLLDFILADVLSCYRAFRGRQYVPSC